MTGLVWLLLFLYSSILSTTLDLGSCDTSAFKISPLAVVAVVVVVVLAAADAAVLLLAALAAVDVLVLLEEQHMWLNASISERNSDAFEIFASRLIPTSLYENWIFDNTSVR